MGVRITNSDWGVPGLGSPGKQHMHLPFWYDVKVENTPPTPAEAFVQLAMFWMMPFVAQRDNAADMREQLLQSSAFIGRRMGLKLDHTFKVMQQGSDCLRFAFATLGGLKRFNTGMSRLDHGSIPEARNDPDIKAPLSTLALLPNADLGSAPLPSAFTPVSGGTLQTFDVKGLRAANNRHARPKAQVLALRS